MSGILKKVNMASITPKRMTLFMLIALMLLGGMGWIMISEKEEYLVQRNFRLLKQWSQDIASKIESSQKVFEFAAKGILGALHSDSNFDQFEDRGGRKRFLRTYEDTQNATGNTHEEHLKLLNKISPWPCPSKNGAAPASKSTQSERIQDLKRHLIGMCEVEGLTTITLTIPERTPTSTKIFQLSVTQYQNPPIIRLSYSTSIKMHGLKENIQIVGEITLGHFLQTLTNEPIFDEALLFESVKGNGNDQPLIFHSGSQEFSWTDFQEIIDRLSPATTFWGSLLGNPQESSQLENESFIHNNSPHQFLIDVPGKTINVFTLPVILPQYKDTDWRIVGMIDHDTFQNSYLAISSILLLGIMFLILGFVLAIPLLYLKTMGAADPLRITHVLTVILAAFLGAGLFTVVILDVAIYGEGKTTLHKSMESSAQAIKKNLDQELKSILFTLDLFDQSYFLKEDRDGVNGGYVPFSRRGEEKLKVGRRSVLFEVLEDQGNPGNLMKSLCPSQEEKKAQPCYSDFRLAFWMDQDGSLRINWAKEQALGVTTNLSLQGREYVKRVLKNPENLWQISDRTGSKHYQFFLEPIMSWTTGLNTVVASMPSQITTEPTTPWVAAMEFQFLSLMDHVVLPPGIGFAVIDSNHNVLFHSKEKRNLREAFLVETDHNPKLRNLFASKTAGHADGSYQGKSTSFYTLPLGPLPWALVVFRDREILRSVNLLGLLVTGSLYGLWSILVYGIAWLLLLRTPEHRKAICLWPKPEYHHHYVNLIKNNLAMFFVGLVGMWLLSGQPGWQLLTGLVIIPGSCLLSARFLVKKFPLPQKTSMFTFPNSYAYLASSFLLVFAVIPAFGCFTSVFHKDMTLLTQYQLLETFKTFQDSGKQQTWTLKNISFPTDCGTSTIESPQAKPYGFYPDFFLETTWTVCNHRGDTAVTHELEMFDQLFALVSQPFLPLLKNVPLREFFRESWPLQTTAPITGWKNDKAGVTMFFKDDQTQASAPLPLRPWFLTGNLPDLRSLTFGNVHFSLFLLVLVSLLIAWLYNIPKFIASRTVFLGYPIPRRISINRLFDSTNQTPPSMNRLILGFPGQGKTSMAHHYHKEQEIHQNNTNARGLYFDLRAIPPEQWEDALSNNISALHIQDHHSLHVTIDHLEQQWNDPEVNRQKLKFLEWLLNRTHHTTGVPDMTSSPDQAP